MIQCSDGSRISLRKPQPQWDVNPNFFSENCMKMKKNWAESGLRPLRLPDPPIQGLTSMLRHFYLIGSTIHKANNFEAFRGEDIQVTGNVLPMSSGVIQ